MLSGNEHSTSMASRQRRFTSQQDFSLQKQWRPQRPLGTFSGATSVPNIGSNGYQSQQATSAFSNQQTQNAVFDTSLFHDEGAGNIFLGGNRSGQLGSMARQTDFAHTYRQNPTGALEERYSIHPIREEDHSANMEMWTSHLGGVPSSRPQLYHMMTQPHLSNHGRPAFPHGAELAEFSSPKLQMAAMDVDSLLHNACKLYPNTLTVVQSALQCDPEAVRRKIPMVCIAPDDQQDLANNYAARRLAVERYGYPINIALKRRASRDVLEFLMESGPDVLILLDGPDQMTSLGIALTSNLGDEIIGALIQANPDCVSTADRLGNYPLHIAVRCTGASLDIITSLYHAYPGAVNERNFHGESPVDVAVRCAFCSERIVDYLQHVSTAHLESTAMDLDNFDELDFL